MKTRMLKDSATGTGANAGEFITAIVGVAWLGQAKPKIRQFGSTANQGYMIHFTDYLNHQRSQHKVRENVTNGPIHGQISGCLFQPNLGESVYS